MRKAKCPPSLTAGTEEVGITWGGVTNTRVANKGDSIWKKMELVTLAMSPTCHSKSPISIPSRHTSDIVS